MADRAGGARPRLPRTVLLAPQNGGLAMARALGAAGERPVVLACPSDAFVAASRGVEGEVLPALAEDRETWLERIAAQGEAIVVPGSDAASEFLAEERGRLPAAIRTFESDDGRHLALMGKPGSHALADRAGIPRPRSFVVASTADLERAVMQATYPCIVKPALSHRWRAVFGEQRVILARSAGELLKAGRQGLGAELEIVVSEYVPGDDDAVEEAILVRAADGSYPVEVGCRKLRQYPAGFGAASLCQTAPIPETVALAKRLLDAAGFVGVAGIETKRHADTGERYFLDANVRLPTQWGLGDAAGGDSSWRLCAALAGLPLEPQPAIATGVKLVFPQLELRAALAHLGSPNGGPSLARRLRSWSGAGDLGIADPRDAGPGIALARGIVGRRVRAQWSGVAKKADSS